MGITYMLNATRGGKKDLSTMLLFLPLLILAGFLLYLTISIPFRMGLTSGTRDAAYYVPDKDNEAEEPKIVDHRKLIQPTPELIALGAKVYGANCASCHGDKGYGDGAAGKNLARKPRSYHSKDGWINGTSVLQMYSTLEKGVGVGMAAQTALTPEQKYAVIHFAHSDFMKEIGYTETTQADIDSLPAPALGGGAVKIDPYAETRMPIEFALRKLVEKTAVQAPKPAATHGGGLGKSLYEANCSTCHGPSGEGVRPRKLGSALQLQQLAWGSSLLGGEAKWTEDYESFQKIVTEGVPSGIKPGFPTLTENELKALHEYTKSLRR